MAAQLQNFMQEKVNVLKEPMVMMEMTDLYALEKMELDQFMEVKFQMTFTQTT